MVGGRSQKLQMICTQFGYKGQSPFGVGPSVSSSHVSAADVSMQWTHWECSMGAEECLLEL